MLLCKYDDNALIINDIGLCLNLKLLTKDLIDQGFLEGLGGGDFRF